ncbi:MAG: hypothetical protein CL459_03005 [Acidimicrobiaceae bacterium]|nr:hypothetical protein [Acidimicrobiaceae bacterium]
MRSTVAWSRSPTTTGCSQPVVVLTTRTASGPATAWQMPQPMQRPCSTMAERRSAGLRRYTRAI